LQSAGYETAYIGKWHMGEHSDDKRPGFDYFVTHKGQGQYFDTVFNFNGQDRRKVPGYYTHVVTEMAQKWLNQPREKPWMLILGHKAPHSFYIPEPKYAHAFDHVDFPYPESSKQLDGKPEWVRQRLTTWHGIYGPLFDFRKKFPDTRPEAVADFSAMIRAYLATLISVDDSVGMVLETLQQRGELDRTLILHLGDNGLLNGEHGMVDKRAAHEPSMRIPLLARYPGLTPTNKPQVVREQILTIDLSPTILDVCGLPPLPGTQGRSFRPLVSGATTAWRDSWVYEYNYEKQFPYTPNVRALRTDRWKYIRYPHGDGSPDRHKAELYDLQADPDELTNLIDRPEQAERVAALAQELDKRSREIGRDTMPLDLGIKQGLPDQAIR
jgi:N-acetylglucosamine-6-sulfatase